MTRWLRLLSLCLLALAYCAQTELASAQAAAPPNPHAGNTIPQNESVPDPALPKGSIEAVILSPDRTPIAGSEVRLGIMFQKISEGESRSERFAKTDANGHARFSDLKVASEYSYRVTVKSGPAEYASLPFNLGEAGQRVTLYVFPVTRDVNQALIGARGIIYIEPRDEVFALDVLFRVFNIGTVSWVPDNVVIRLPPGFKAVSAQRSMSNTGFEPVDAGVRLTGTFSPGQHDVSFRFQMPKSGEPSAAFNVGLLPRVFDMRVIAEASSKMHVSVAGFPPTQTDMNRGKRVVYTQQTAQAGSSNLSSVAISLDGLPVPGPGRWYAVLIAAGLAGIGLLTARGLLQLDERSDPTYDRQQARELLLEELVEVERARKAGELGPRAYSDAKKTLLDALARLGADVLAPVRKKRRKVAA